MTLEEFRTNYIVDKQAKAYLSFINIIEKLYIPIFIILAMITFFFCFYHLDSGYVNSFDEARHGINAYEMLKSGNLFVNTYGYENDYWNLKPPLSYWCIMIGYKIFGYNIFGMRFYSALSYFITVIVIALFARRYGRLESLIIMSFLCVNGLAYTAHMVRTGDADSLYIMLFSFAIIFMLCIKNNHRYLYLCGLMFALAFLTKSFHSAMIAAIGGLFLLCTGIIKEIKPKEWLFFILSFTIPIFIWAAFRFTQDQTLFFTQMISQDLLNRTGSAIEGHAYPANFYFDYVFRGNYIYLPLMIICFTGSVFFDKYFSKKSASFDNMLAHLLWFFIPFMGFSLVKTKLIWYVYPCIIPLSIVAGVFIGRFLKSERLYYKTKWAITALILFITIFYAKDCYNIISNQNADAYQQFIINSSSRNGYFSGANAYTYNLADDGNSIEDWTQADMLLGELYGDYRCLDDGLDGFINDDSDNPVLFIKSDYYKALSNKLLKNCTVVYEEVSDDVSYSLITKKR